MENNNLGSKKINGTQKDSEELKGKNVSHDKEPDASKLKKEVVTDADGNKEIVDRARNVNENIKEVSKEIDPDNPNANRGVSTDEEAKKTVENKDRNSDVNPNRYPNSHPDNHEDRGNMKLDD
jgi:predicted  nucleic acid-binding Zn-ribbon protein